MRPTDNIKNLFRKLKIPTSPGLDEKIHKEISQVTGQKNKNILAQPVLWRIIMKSKITKFATAIVIIGVVIFGITLFDKTTTPAYAFEQTLEAFRDVNSIHLWGRDMRDNDFEMWVQLNEETGMPEYCHLYTPGQNYLAISRPDKSYQYIKTLNAVQVSKGMLFGYMECAPAYIFEELVKYSNTNNSDIKVDISYENDPESGKTIIKAIYESPLEKWDIDIDPKTKLPIRLNLLSETHRTGLTFKNVVKIEYNVKLPEAIFEFEIPEGARVIEQ